MRSSFRIHDHDPLSIVADGLDRTFLHRRQAPSFFRGITRLPAHVTMPLRIFTKEVERSGLSTEIAIDASIVDVIPARHVLSCFPSLIWHALAVRSETWVAGSIDSARDQGNPSEFVSDTGPGSPRLSQ